MTVELLNEHHLEFLSLKRGCTGLSENATLLEITCRGSIILFSLLLYIPSQRLWSWQDGLILNKEHQLDAVKGQKIHKTYSDLYNFLLLLNVHMKT